MAIESQLLQDLAIVMGTAALVAVAFQQLRLPLVFGFLVAGVIIGPHTPPFQLVHDEQSLETLGNLGVVLLLFGLGLDFNLRRLRRVGGISFLVMITEVLFMFWLGFELGQLIGWSPIDSIFLGAMISISSTAIIVKVLRDQGRLEQDSSQIIFGVLVLEDIAAILMLVLLSGYAATGDLGFSEVAMVSARMALFLVGSIAIGLLAVPRFVDHIVSRHGNEILVITLVGLAFGYAALSEVFQFHVGLGAFIMGALVAEAKRHEHVVQQFRPVHDVFAAIFFVTIGTLVDFAILQAYWKPVLAVCFIVIVGKLLSGAIPTFLAGYGSPAAIAVGAGLAQMGEFSFVIAQLGMQTGVTSDFLFPIVIGAAALSSLTAPLMIAGSGAIARGLGRVAPAPLRTYAKVYTTWMRAVRNKPSPARQAQRVKARRSAVVGLLLLTAGLGTAWLARDRARNALASQGFAEPLRTLTYWGVVLALLLPVLFQLFRALNRWIATWDLPDGRKGGINARRVLQTTFYLLGTIVLGLPVLVATAPFLRTPVIVAAWVGMVGSAAVILWATITRLHARIERNLQVLLDDEHVPLRAPQVVQDLMTSELPWELGIDAFELRPSTWASGKRLGEIDLRSATGATLILVERGDAREETPGPATVLLPGDRLTLIGTPEQLAAARAVFARPVPPGPRRPQLRIGRLFVAEGSELEGMKLSEAALPRRSGIQVVAILRGEKVISNPGANEKLRAGDVVLVLGAQEAIASATELGRPQPPPAPRSEGAPG